MAAATPASHFGFVNTPVFRGSTVLFPDLDTIENHTQPYFYGRTGNPSTASVEEVISELEGAAGTRLAPLRPVGHRHSHPVRGRRRRRYPCHR